MPREDLGTEEISDKKPALDIRGAILELLSARKPGSSA